MSARAAEDADQSTRRARDAKENGEGRKNTAFSRIFRRTMESALFWQCAALGCVLVYFLTRWATMREFVLDIDHGDLLFADYIFHYYPTGHDVFTTSAPAGGFFYPASFAVMLSPICAMDPDHARTAWLTIEIVTSVLACISLPRLAVPRDAPRKARVRTLTLGTALYATSVPLLHNFKWGQVSIFIVLLVAFGYAAYARAKTTRAAVLLALAVGIKMYPAIFFMRFLPRKDARFLVKGALVSIAVLALLPAITMGPLRALAFQKVSTGSVVGASHGVLMDFNSQYFPAVVSRHLEGPMEMPASYWTKMGAVSYGIAAVLALTVAWIEQRKRAEGGTRWIGVLAIEAGIVPFVIQTSWSHYFAFVPLAQTWLFFELAQRCGRGGPRSWRAWAIGLLLLVPSAVLTNVMTMFAWGGWLPFTFPGTLFVASALTVGACVLTLILPKNGQPSDGRVVGP